MFTDVHELLLRKYILRVSVLSFGQTLMEIRKLAHEYAIKHEHNILMSWAEHGWTGKVFESSCTTIINKS